MNWILYIAFNFVLYSFIGWVIEEVYSYFAEHHFKKDGFLKSPFKPMYGITATIVIYLYNRYVLNIFQLGLLISIVPLIVEYISGYSLKKLFNKEYWSYKDIKYNLKGYICLKFAIYWVILMVIGVFVLEPLTDFVFFKFTSIMEFVVPVMIAFLFLDLVVTTERLRS